mgnify:CR=1 FL=1
MRRLLRENSLGLGFGALFLGTLVGQALVLDGLLPGSPPGLVLITTKLHVPRVRPGFVPGDARLFQRRVPARRPTRRSRSGACDG